MRKWVPLLLAVVLVPVLAPNARAQEPPPKQERPKEVQRLITQARASDIALAQVTREVQSRSIEAWNGKAPSGLKVVSASQSNLGGRAAYIVAVMMMKSTGIVRLTLDAKNGQVIDRQVGASWDWGNAPAWWKAGLNSPPPAKAR